MWLTFLTSPPRPGSITFGVDVGRHVAVLPPRSRLRYAVSVCAAAYRTWFAYVRRPRLAGR
jgi:hypothetical protein